MQIFQQICQISVSCPSKKYKLKQLPWLKNANQYLNDQFLQETWEDAGQKTKIKEVKVEERETEQKKTIKNINK